VKVATPQALIRRVQRQRTGVPEFVMLEFRICAQGGPRPVGRVHLGRRIEGARMVQGARVLMQPYLVALKAVHSKGPHENGQLALIRVFSTSPHSNSFVFVISQSVHHLPL
jgi:hypothetical protein